MLKKLFLCASLMSFAAHANLDVEMLEKEIKNRHWTDADAFVDGGKKNPLLEPAFFILPPFVKNTKQQF